MGLWPKFDMSGKIYQPRDQAQDMDNDKRITWNMFSWFVHPSDHQPPLPRFPHSGYVRSPSWTRGCKGEQQPRDRKHHSDSENTEPLLKIERSQSQQPWATASYVGSERTRRPCPGDEDFFPRKWWGISERTQRPLLKIQRFFCLNEANQANK